MSTQEQVLDWLSKDAKSPTLITGGAGRGKSYLLNKIAKERGKGIVLGAPTGIAALNVGGETMHSLLGLPTSLVTEDDKNQISKRAKTLFKRAEYLAIDEIGMFRADYLDLVDHKLKQIRKSKEAFGGIQLIGIGDFFQLEPIVSRDEKPHFKYDSPFCFDSEIWGETNFNIFELTKCYRQESERQVKILDSVRTKDKHHALAIKKINEMSLPVSADDLTFTLTSYKSDADYINTLGYSELEGEEMVYTAEVSGKFYERPVEEKIKLKVGAKVIICANDSDTGSYKNGERGEVVRLFRDAVFVKKVSGDVVEVVPFKWDRYSYNAGSGGISKDVIASYTQIPLRLGYACTIHKLQGCTLDSAKLDLGRGTFSHGQLYVAVSRIRDLENLMLSRLIRQSDLIVDERVKQFYDKIKSIIE